MWLEKSLPEGVSEPVLRMKTTRSSLTGSQRGTWDQQHQHHVVGVGPIGQWCGIGSALPGKRCQGPQAQASRLMSSCGLSGSFEIQYRSVERQNS